MNFDILKIFYAEITQWQSAIMVIFLSQTVCSLSIFGRRKTLLIIHMHMASETLLSITFTYRTLYHLNDYNFQLEYLKMNVYRYGNIIWRLIFISEYFSHLQWSFIGKKSNLDEMLRYIQFNLKYLSHIPILNSI